MYTEKKRVETLYRVSTKGQVDKNDIPMQKQRCREFAEQMGWEIVKEVSELGVSGFKVATKDRDAIQEIQQDAALGKFDVLLVFMFDRLGRRDDETPFVVEWFVRNGVEVWSTEEGQQRFDSHVDKLMNYIRYWQASGESIKTSIRTKTRMAQIIQEGCFRGGGVAYGYRLEKQGRINKKNHECYEILVDEREAEIVKLIYSKYVNEGLGGHRLVRYLLEQGIRNRKGDNFANTTITRILKNVSYLGVLRSRDTYSEIFPHLQIIDPDTFDRAQEIMKKRAEKLEHSEIPLNTKGKALLHGLVYCGHCGHKLTLTTSGTRYRTEDGKTVPQMRYCCHYKVRHPQSCEGQSGYSTTKLDEIVEDVILDIFSHFKSTPKEELIGNQQKRQRRICEAALEAAKKKRKEVQDNLTLYKGEIAKSLCGKSKWDAELLQDMIAETKFQLEQAEHDVAIRMDEYENISAQSEKIRKKYDSISSWADLYVLSTMEAKKMIVSQLIKQIRVNRDYRLEIELNVGYEELYCYIQNLRGDAALVVQRKTA